MTKWNEVSTHEVECENVGWRQELLFLTLVASAFHDLNLRWDTTAWCELSPPCHSCPLLYLFPSPPAGKTNISFSQRTLLDLYPLLFNSAVKNQLRRDSGILPAPSPSGSLNARRLSAHPEHCLPACTHTRLIWPGTLTSCQTHTHRQKNIDFDCFLSRSKNLNHFLRQEVDADAELKATTEPPARFNTETVDAANNDYTCS